MGARRHPFLVRIIAFWLVLALIFPPQAIGQSLSFLPSVGAMVPLSPSFTPLLLRGLRVYPSKPFQFDFIVDTGNSKFQDEKLRSETTRLIKYFLATLTTPENELWVNLSPYEKDRIIPKALGTTEMGKDLLSQDYILKQLTASLMYPENDLGKTFWDKVRKEIYAKYGTTELPVDTFNKVWIVPEKAVVYENGGTAFVSEAHLKVLLETDYLAREKSDQWSVVSGQKKEELNTEHRSSDLAENTDHQLVTTEIIRSTILPAIEKEVNEGENFSMLRQIYYSMILAVWYKTNLKQSILNKVYIDKNKTAGVDIEDKNVKDKIYSQYLEAFKKGVYNYIKEDYDLATQSVVPRKYFSGGTNFKDMALITDTRKGMPTDFKTDGALLAVAVKTQEPELKKDAAMLSLREALSQVFDSLNFKTSMYRGIIGVPVISTFSAEEKKGLEPLLALYGERLRAHAPMSEETKRTVFYLIGLIRYSAGVMNFNIDKDRSKNWALARMFIKQTQFNRWSVLLKAARPLKSVFYSDYNHDFISGGVNYGLMKRFTPEEIDSLGIKPVVERVYDSKLKKWFKPDSKDLPEEYKRDAEFIKTATDLLALNADGRGLGQLTSEDADARLEQVIQMYERIYGQNLWDFPDPVRPADAAMLAGSMVSGQAQLDQLKQERNFTQKQLENLQYLVNLGVVNIRHLVESSSNLMKYKLDNGVQPKIDYLMAHGVQNIGHVIDIYPEILGLSLENIKETVNYLMKNGVLNIGELIEKFPMILGYNFDNHIVPIVELIKILQPQSPIDWKDLKELLKQNIQILKFILEIIQETGLQGITPRGLIKIYVKLNKDSRIKMGFSVAKRLKAVSLPEDRQKIENEIKQEIRKLLEHDFTKNVLRKEKDKIFGKLYSRISLPINGAFDELVTRGITPQNEGTEPISKLLNNYGPRYEIEINDGNAYFLSEPRTNMDGHVFFVAWVYQDGVIHVRYLYKSDSSIGWRVATHRSDGHFLGKGANGEITTDVPGEIEQALNGIVARSQLNDDNYQAYDMVLPFLERKEDIPDSFADVITNPAVNDDNPIGHFKDDNDPSTFEFESGYEPNFNSGLIETYDDVNKLYGPVKVYRFVSVNRKIQFKFIVDAKGRKFVGSIQSTEEKITSYGTRSEIVHADRKLYAAVLRNMNGGSISIPARYIGPIAAGNYSDISAWTNALPFFKEFEAKYLTREVQSVDEAMLNIEDVKNRILEILQNFGDDQSIRSFKHDKDNLALLGLKLFVESVLAKIESQKSSVLSMGNGQGRKMDDKIFERFAVAIRDLNILLEEISKELLIAGDRAKEIVFSQGFLKIDLKTAKERVRGILKEIDDAGISKGGLEEEYRITRAPKLNDAESFMRDLEDAIAAFDALTTGMEAEKRLFLRTKMHELEDIYKQVRSLQDHAMVGETAVSKKSADAAMLSEGLLRSASILDADSDLYYEELTRYLQEKGREKIEKQKQRLMVFIHVIEQDMPIYDELSPQKWTLDDLRTMMQMPELSMNEAIELIQAANAFWTSIRLEVDGDQRFWLIKLNEDPSVKKEKELRKFMMYVTEIYEVPFFSPKEFDQKWTFDQFRTMIHWPELSDTDIIEFSTQANDRWAKKKWDQKLVIEKNLIWRVKTSDAAMTSTVPPEAQAEFERLKILISAGSANVEKPYDVIRQMKDLVRKNPSLRSQVLTVFKNALFIYKDVSSGIIRILRNSDYRELPLEDVELFKNAAIGGDQVIASVLREVIVSDSQFQAQALEALELAVEAGNERASQEINRFGENNVSIFTASLAKRIENAMTAGKWNEELYFLAVRLVAGRKDLVKPSFLAAAEKVLLTGQLNAAELIGYIAEYEPELIQTSTVDALERSLALFEKEETYKEEKVYKSLERIAIHIPSFAERSILVLGNMAKRLDRNRLVSGNLKDIARAKKELLPLVVEVLASAMKARNIESFEAMAELVEIYPDIQEGSSSFKDELEESLALLESEGTSIIGERTYAALRRFAIHVPAFSDRIIVLLGEIAKRSEKDQVVSKQLENIAKARKDLLPLVVEVLAQAMKVKNEESFEAMAELVYLYSDIKEDFFSSEEAKKAWLWTRNKIPFNAQMYEEYLASGNPKNFIEARVKEAMQLIENGFDITEALGDPKMLAIIYLGVSYSGIRGVSFQEFEKRMKALEKVENKMPGSFARLFQKAKAYPAIQLAKEGNELDLKNVKKEVLESHLEELKSIAENMKDLSIVVPLLKDRFDDFLRRTLAYYEISNKFQDDKGLEEKLGPINSKLLKNHIQQYFKGLSTGQVRGDVLQIPADVRYKTMVQVADLVSSHLTIDPDGVFAQIMRIVILANEFSDDWASQMESSHALAQVSAFESFYLDAKHHLPNDLNLSIDKMPKLKKEFEKFTVGLFTELAKAVEIKGQGVTGYNLVPVGFLGVFRGRAGMIDCSFDFDKGTPFTRAMHEDTAYYFIYKGKELKGYVGMQAAKNEVGNNILAIDTINSPSINSEDLLRELLGKLSDVAKEKGFKGIALPASLDASFNFDNKTIVETMTEYEKGTPIKLKTVHEKTWRQFSESEVVNKEGLDFGIDKYNSIETGNFINIEIDQHADEAMSAPGGIDLNPKSLDLQTKGKKFDLNVPVDNASLSNLEINGLTPVIIRIVPLTNLQMFLSSAPEERAEELSLK